MKIKDLLEKFWNVSKIWNWFLSLNKNGKIALGIFLVLMVVLPILFFDSKQEKKEDPATGRLVEKISVAETSNISSPLSLVGVVESVSEATIRSEVGGQLTRVNKKLGDRVFAGEVIAQFENAGERAAVLQAEGALDQAKAAKSIATINAGTSGSGLETAKQNALNSFSSTFATMEEIIRVKTDVAFVNPDRYDIAFNVLVPDQILIGQIEYKRREIQNLLTQRANKNKLININSLLENELDILANELNQIKNYLDDVSRAYNNSLPNQNYNQTQLDTAKNVVAAARMQIAGTINSITGVKQALVAAKATSDISSINGNPSLASSDAAIKIAQGTYYAALARLQKTIIRSPITGTINSFNVQMGDYLSPSQQVAVVSNNGALEVVTHISSEDAKRVNVGDVATLNQNIPAVVTRVASALDPLTRKIEVRIGIKNEIRTLINGQSVKVEIKGLDLAKKQEVKKNILTNKPIKVYLSSVKITPRGNFVFMINPDKTLKSVEVELGRITNDMVEVVVGLSPEDEIVKDARGLKEGNMVEIKDNY